MLSVQNLGITSLAFMALTCCVFGGTNDIWQLQTGSSLYIGADCTGNDTSQTATSTTAGGADLLSLSDAVYATNSEVVLSSATNTDEQTVASVSCLLDTENECYANHSIDLEYELAHATGGTSTNITVYVTATLEHQGGGSGDASLEIGSLNFSLSGTESDTYTLTMSTGDTLDIIANVDVDSTPNLTTQTALTIEVSTVAP